MGFIQYLIGVYRTAISTRNPASSLAGYMDGPIASYQFGKGERTPDMSESLAVGGAVASPDANARVQSALLDSRRKLQLGLGVIWLLDGFLQLQPFMFGKGFPQMLAGNAPGNPAFVASPITWSAGFIDHHLVVLNAVFAFIQLALGLGIAWRPTVRLALAASVPWALGVWWVGEGLGGVLAGNASPVNGAPGAVVLYALLAVLLWPADRAPGASASFAAARAVGPRVARVLWLLVWASMAVFALLPASRAPQATSGLIARMAAGEPGWLAWIDAHAASALRGQGLLASIVLAAALALVAFGIYLPDRAVKAVIALALVVAALLWLAQGMGGIFTGSGTDPNTGPLLALLALAFWPAAPSPAGPAPAGPAAEA
jgi:hypothetical protein